MCAAVSFSMLWFWVRFLMSDCLVILCCMQRLTTLLRLSSFFLILYIYKRRDPTPSTILPLEIPLRFKMFIHH